MITFEKSVKKVLPYDRNQYISLKHWYGVSIQLPGVFEGKDISLDLYLEAYNEWFKEIISKLDDESYWIVNHDLIDEDWFPNKQRNLLNLRNIFKLNKVPNTFKGALLLTTPELLSLATDLICYPFAVFDEKKILYNNLDITQSGRPFVIKITAHSTIDLLSRDKDFLSRFVKENSSNLFVLKEYRGTSL